MSDLNVTAGMPDKMVQALLQEAVGLLQKNQMTEAETQLGRVLDERPNDPDALQLLGVIRRTQHREAEAEDHYRRSLAAKPDQPQVHHNLGNLLAALGRFDEAIVEQREAIRLKPNYVVAHLNLGLALSSKGDNAGAEKSVREALRMQPNFLIAQQSLAAILNDSDRPAEAEAILRRGLAAGARDPRQIAAFEHSLGVSSKLQARYDEAIRLFDSAQAKAPDMPMVDYNRGNALQHLGQLDAAVESYRRALARNPLDMLAHRDLNHVLYRLGDDAAFLRSYDDAMALFPEAGGLALAKGDFLFLTEKFEKAQEEFERASALLPTSALPHQTLGMVHARQGNFDKAIREHEIALGIDPESFHGWRNFSETLLRAGDAKKGLEAVERSLALEPDNQATLAIYGTALSMLDDLRGETLNDYANFVQEFTIEPPQGYKDIATFNADLNHYLDKLHRDKREIVDQTLRGGTQTLEDLFGRGHDLVERLRGKIEDAVRVYIGRMKENEDHPLLKRRSAKFGYSGSWSARLYDCGFHTNHFHTKGWISSAYYVSLPDAVNDAKDKQGWIKFGEAAFDTGQKEPIRRIIQPEIGKLVLFPSYMWHGTVPFRSDAARTTVAFDVVPK
ncbi:MAG TPA: tetratricopeptide repeat protein [Rhizomicrobium sp.]